MRAGCRNFEGGKRGFILVSVLMLSMLLLGSATAFAWFARQEMRRVADEEFALVSRSVATLACQTVMQWIGEDGNDFDSVHEFLYSQRFPLVLPYGEWLATMRVHPQNRQIPINALFLPDGVTLKNEYTYPWQQVWRIVAEDEIATLVLDFLDKDRTARPGSREDVEFPNRSIGDLSELLRLPEIQMNTLYKRYSPTDLGLDSFFTVYGEGPININFAPREVLAVLDSAMGVDIADAILNFRAESSITSEKDLIKIPGFPIAVTTKLKDVIGYKSDFFLVDIKIQRESKERNFQVMLKRDGSACQIVNWRE